MPIQNNDTTVCDSQSATEYDSQARKTNWYGPEVVFGLTNENCIARLLGQTRFELLKAQQFIAFKHPAKKKDIYFRAYVVCKK